jgi:thiol:disulfide interchange protein
MEQTNSAPLNSIFTMSKSSDDRSASGMPKAFLVLAAALLLARIAANVFVMTTSPPQAQQVKWYSPLIFSEGLPPEQDRTIVYQFYAKWSDPCKRMDAAAFSNSEVRQLMKEKFVPIRIIDVSHEQGKNPQWITDLEKKYRVFALPTLVVVDEDGKTLGSLIGDCSSLTTYRFLTRAEAAHTGPRVKPLQMLEY